MSDLELTGDEWRALGLVGSQRLQADAFEAVVAAVAAAADDPGIRIADVLADHLPLAALVALLEGGARRPVDAAGDPSAAAPPTARARGGHGRGRRPFVVGITGGVAAGKSLTAAVVDALLRHAHGRTVAVVSTDGFLLPNAELERRGLAHRKGFPESYDHPSLLTFLGEARAGRADLSAPRYDHVRYDVLHDDRLPVGRPDVLVVEGINVLQATGDGTGPQVSDHLDFSLYVDAHADDLRSWFLARLLAVRARSAGDPASFYAGVAALSDDELTAMGEAVWATVNGPNVEQHIAPTRDRADLVLEKASDHRVRRARLRGGRAGEAVGADR